MKQNIKCSITNNKINIMNAIQFVQSSELGAQNIFIGTVRSPNHNQEVVSVHYDVFEPMALNTFNEIANEVLAKLSMSLKIYIEHRVGICPTGEESIVIAVGSKHREDSYKASRYIIEEIKKRSPIWKKEIYSTGESEWLQGHSLCQYSNGVEHSLY